MNKVLFSKYIMAKVNNRIDLASNDDELVKLINDMLKGVNIHIKNFEELGSICQGNFSDEYGYKFAAVILRDVVQAKRYPAEYNFNDFASFAYQAFAFPMGCVDAFDKTDPNFEYEMSMIEKVYRTIT